MPALGADMDEGTILEWRVGPGDTILIPPGARHQIRADADGRLRFLCCCAPAYAHEDTFF